MISKYLHGVLLMFFIVFKVEASEWKRGWDLKTHNSIIVSPDVGTQPLFTEF